MRTDANKVPSSSREVYEGERDSANTIFGLIKKLEDATITEILENKELVQMPSEDITDVESIYEHFTDDVADYFLFDYVKKVIEAKNKGWWLETIMHHFRRVKDQTIYLVIRDIMNNKEQNVRNS